MDTRIQPHNAKPSATWSSGGLAYDEVSRQIAAALEHCARRADVRPGERVLDLATGTGWTSRLLASRGAEVTGVDIAEDLIAAANSLSQLQAMKIRYEVGDAEKLRFEDGQFDVLVSTFGVMFASNPEAAAAEMARVCRKGGRIALAVWKSDGAVFEMFKVMRAFMPTPPPNAPPSPFAWGTQARLTELLGSSFDLRFEEGVATYYDRDGKAAWETFVTGYGPTKVLAAGLDVTKRAQLERDFIAFHDRFASPLGISVPREYIVVAGTRK